MPFCPECRYEYNPDVEKCPDCGARLVDQLPAKDELVWQDLVCVATYPFEAGAQLARLKLNSHGIDAWLANEKMSQLDIILVFADSGVKLMVRPEDAERARQILDAK